jgi:hypothetical protein
MSENTPKIPEKKPESRPGKPDEQVGFYFSSFVKITDPNTKEVLVQKRGDI